MHDERDSGGSASAAAVAVVHTAFGPPTSREAKTIIAALSAMAICGGLADYAENFQLLMLSSSWWSADSYAGVALATTWKFRFFVDNLLLLIGAAAMAAWYSHKRGSR